MEHNHHQGEAPLLICVASYTAYRISRPHNRVFKSRHKDQLQTRGSPSQVHKTQPPKLKKCAHRNMTLSRVFWRVSSSGVSTAVGHHVQDIAELRTALVSVQLFRDKARQGETREFLSTQKDEPRGGGCRGTPIPNGSENSERWSQQPELQRTPASSKAPSRCTPSLLRSIRFPSSRFPRTERRRRPGPRRPAWRAGSPEPATGSREAARLGKKVHVQTHTQWGWMKLDGSTRPHEIRTG